MTARLSSGRLRRAMKTSLSSGVVSLLTVAVGILSVPMLTGYLGADGYGIVVTATALAGWLGIGDAGFGLSLKNALVRAFAHTEDDADAIRARLFATSFVLVAALSTSIFLGLLLPIIAAPLEFIFNVTSDSVSKIRWLLAVTAGVTLLGLPLQLVVADYSARQSEFSYNPWRVLGRLASLLLVVVAVYFDLGLVFAGASVLVGQGLGNILAFAWFRLRVLRFRVADFDSSLLPQLTHTGVAFFAIKVASLLIFQIDVFLANFLVGNSEAASYRLHLQLFAYCEAVMALIIGPFWPALGDAATRKDYIWFQKTLRRLFGLACLVSFGYGIVIYLTGQHLMPVWSSSTVEWDRTLALLVGTFVVLRVVTHVPATALGALGAVRSHAAFVTAQALLNLVLSVWWGKLAGLHGIAAASLASYLLTSAWFVPWRLKREIRSWS